jgi:histidine triad (HIT) family protein
MRDVCVFCERIDDLDYDDTDLREVVSFEPLNPVTLGHRLFVPIAHVGSAAASPILAARAVEAAALYASQGQRQHRNFNLITSAGIYATQTGMHLHVHYVPRDPEDGLALPWTGQQR